MPRSADGQPAERPSPARRPPPAEQPPKVQLGGATASVEPGPGGITLRLNGRLDAQSVAELWPKAMDAVSGGGQVKRVRVEASGLKYCDGAGIGLLAGLTIRAKEHGLALEYAGLDSGTQSLLDRALPTADLPRGGPGDSSIVQLGRATAETLASMAMMVSFLGEISRDLVWAATHPHRVRWMDVLLVCEKAGANALPVVCLLGWLMGLIIAFQTAAPLGRFGVDSMIPTMLAIAMVRELGPLVTAIILAGRSGSAFAAEIGTMKVTEELNALTTLGLDPVRFLALPRLIATMLMTPLLSLFAIIFGLAGGYLVMLSLGYSLSFYVNQVLAAVDYVDLLGGLFKSVVFAFLVAGVGCVRGLQTQQGPGAVGDSTTRAVVAGIVLIVVADGVLGGVFYAIGV